MTEYIAEGFLGVDFGWKEADIKNKRLIKILVIVVLLVGLVSLPRTLLLPVYREGVRIVKILADYKDEHGVYPDSLERLGVEIKYDAEGWRGIRYITSEDGNEFRLTCYCGLGNLREVYSSETKQWSTLH